MSERRRATSGHAAHLIDGKDRYKWWALAIVTFGAVMVTINQSMVLIALPDIFRGIRLNPSISANTGYMLWMLIGFTVAVTVLVVTLGRVGDIYGRVRTFSLGFAVFTSFSVMLAITWLDGSRGAMWLIGMRIGQGIGGALIFANASAILTDAFPLRQRGLSLGVYIVTLNAGGFVGLIIGGVLAPLWWRSIFVLSVPFGLVGTVAAYRILDNRSLRASARIDWLGNVAFAIGLVSILIGITYGLLPYAGHAMGWTSPVVRGEIVGGVGVLGIFALIETRVAHPMFHLALFRVRAFSTGNVAVFLASLSRGGLLVLLVVWFQGIWLPLHGYSFSSTPFWAGIYMVPLTVGFLVSGPVSGMLADRFGARPFATVGLVVVAITFLLLPDLSVDFGYWSLAPIILLNSLGMGMFIAPNQSAIMNSLPPDQRGVGAGMAGTFNWSAQVLSTGLFFTLMILGMSSGLSSSLYHGLVARGVGTTTALRVSRLSPVASLFAAFLGYNPMKTLIGATALSKIPTQTASSLVGRTFFPRLVASSFHNGLKVAFIFAACVSALGALVSFLRGRQYVHGEVVTSRRIPLDAAIPASEAVVDTDVVLGE